MKKILIGCEESQVVTIEFRKLGFEAYSCDILPCSGGHPEWHIQDSIFHVQGSRNALKWDLCIFFPPCTFLANSSSKHLYIDGKKENGINVDRWDNMELGALFFNSLLATNCDKIAIENPIQHKHARKLIRKYDQIIQPYEHGHLEKKSTCLWLKGLPELKETDNVYNEMMKLDYKDRAKVHYCSPGPERQKLRSKTYPGIAKAMAAQWSKVL